jgi:hypothetical protein
MKEGGEVIILTSYEIKLDIEDYKNMKIGKRKL